MLQTPEAAARRRLASLLADDQAYREIHERVLGPTEGLRPSVLRAAVRAACSEYWLSDTVGAARLVAACEVEPYWPLMPDEIDERYIDEEPDPAGAVRRTVDAAFGDAEAPFPEAAVQGPR